MSDKMYNTYGDVVYEDGNELGKRKEQLSFEQAKKQPHKCDC